MNPHVPLPFPVPLAAEFSFSVGVEVSAAIDAAGAAEACFDPGVPVVFGGVHGFSVRGGEVVVPISTEFMEHGDFGVVVKEMVPLCLSLSKEEAQAADGAVVAVHVDGLATVGGVVFFVQVAEDHLGLGFQEESFVI